MMNDELLPCPFCGGKAEIIEAEYGMYMTGYAVYCRKCCLKLGVTGRLGEAYEWSPVFDTKSKAIDTWNSRVEPENGNADTNDALTLLDEIREADRISYDDYSRLFDAIADTWNSRAARTCKFIDSKGSDYPPVCSACGYELGIYDCKWFEDGTYGYDGNYCPNCGAHVEVEL